MKRHEIDVVSLVSGLLFTALAVVFALNALGWVSFDIRVVPATVLIVLGIAGISASVVKTSRSTEAESGSRSDPEPDPEPAAVSTGSTSGPAAEE
jgi:predicted RND superfamily exporter protein